MAQLDPDVAAVLADMAAAGLPPYTSMPPAEARRANAQRNAFWNAEAPVMAGTQDLLVEASGRRVPVRLYVPEASPAITPVIVFVHGGGWVFGSIETHDNIARRLARASGLRVLSVDYALAPERPYPDGLEDVLAVIEALAAGGVAPGLDGTRFALAGDSAGANLSLAACLALRDRGGPGPGAAALVYGAYGDDHDSPSHLAFGDGRYVLTTEAMRWFWGHYVADPAQRRDPLVSPMFADLRGLPPLYMSAAEFDPLRDDSERLVRRAIEAGVDVDWRLWRGMTHATLGWSRRVRRVEGFIAEIGTFLAGRLGAAAVVATGPR